MFYAQLDNYAKEKNYIRSKENFFLTEAELKDLPAGAEIMVEATQRPFCMSVSAPEEKVRYVVDHNGRFTREAIAPRQVKNWVWMRINKEKGDAYYM